MATIVTIAAGDQITNSRADINTNFANLNSAKVETSAIDTDTTLAANSDTRVPSQKAIKAYVDAGGNPFSVETTAAATHSLTTVAGQRVVVWAKGTITADGATINLKYNGVSKDSLTHESQVYKTHFSLMYTETPGAATANITVDATAGSVSDVSILVFKINV